MKQHNNIEQGTEQWHHIRKGKITGTVLKSIMGTPKARQEALYEIIAERLTVGVDMEHENPMDRGTRLEDEAVAAFEFETGLQTEQTGFCQSEESDDIANSPDRLIPKEDAGLEIKCPGGKNYVKAWLTNKVPEEYYWQVIQYFVVNKKAKKLYFVLYNPDIPIHPLHIIIVTRKELGDDIQLALEAEQLFLEEANRLLDPIIPKI